MRHIGSLPDQAAARRFRAWLLSRDTATDIEFEEDQWAIWIHNEDEVDSAREEFDAFATEPEAERYIRAEQALKTARQAEPRPATRPTLPRVRPGQPWVMTPLRNCPASVVLIGLSVLLTGVCVRGFDAKRGALQFDMAYEPVMSRLTFVEIEERDNSVYASTYNLSRACQHLWESVTRGLEYRLPSHGVGQILRGEFWRLVTPAFLHFSIPHILFNLLWLRMLGGEIESRRGLARYVGLVLLIAIVSNAGQYAATGSPLFGGMSGVVYGVFGYLWMKERFAPQAGMSLPPNCVFWMLGWFIICWLDMVGPIANWAHAFGLAAGMLVGLLPTRAPVTGPR